MKRRDFLRQGSLASMALGSVPALGTTHAAVPAMNPNFALEEATVESLQQQLRSGSLTARQLTQQYIDRIRSVDAGPGGLNAVIELNPDALAIADEIDRELKAKRYRGPLQGMPVLIKDNIDTGDKMMTTAGSLALEGHRAAKDAFLVQQLRKAGAIILGKTNLSEWANFRSTRSCSGWSSRGGQTRNPFVLNRNPSGSSSGSGAAVSANLCVVAVGTETDGSITSPASCCGVVGLKPTVGLVSRSGVIPISATQDTAGPMTRTVRDAAILLGAMTGVDPADSVTAASEGKSFASYTRFLDGATLRGKRIGIEKRHLQGHEKVVGLFREAVELMKAQGAEIVEVDFIVKILGIRSGEIIVLQYEFKDGLNKYLASHQTAIPNLEALIRFNEAQAVKTMPWFRQETLEACQAKGGLDTKEYVEALARTTSARKLIDDLLAEQRLDAICGVSSGIPGCIDPLNGDYGTGFSYSSGPAMAGYPHLTVPMGLIGGLPVGLSFVSGAYTEGPLLALGYAFEQASKKRAVPRMLPALAM